MYLPPVHITRDDWWPATYTHPATGETMKVMATNRLTRQDTAEPPYHTYTWVRVSQRTNLPADRKTGDRFFAADRNLTEREH